MGSRIKRSIGWGMPYNDFLALVGLKDDDGVFDGIDEIFQKADKSCFEVEKEYASKTFREKEIDGHACYSILEPNLLSRQFTDFGRKIDRSNFGIAAELYEVTWNGDDCEHIIFYPNLYQKKTWYRSDDDMDYAFERWRDDQTRFSDSPARSFAHYVPYGHYPYSNYLMHENGKYEPWDYYITLQERPEIVPGVPSEIRYYLTKMGLLDNVGVTKLRPILAQWWS